jgi:hypothetical protein
MLNDNHQPFLIRGYRRSDRETVRTLCCDTGFLGEPIDPVYEDRELFADFLTTYYTDHEPESCFLLEVDGEICGYLLGSRKPFQNQLYALYQNVWLFFCCRGVFHKIASARSYHFVIAVWRGNEAECVAWSPRKSVFWWSFFGL